MEKDGITLEGRTDIGNKFMRTTTDMEIEVGEQVLNRSVGYHISILKQRKFGKRVSGNFFLLHIPSIFFKNFPTQRKNV